ncbi:MAG: dTDP-4-dehydrorhamnose 3,5-epimerase family protein [Paracoccaceae bacterium]
MPEGVVLRDLVVHSDDRGALRELYRAEWIDAPAFKQWNLVRSEGRVLRGVHVHPRHADYLHVIEGTMILALHDLRPEDPRDRISCFVTLSADRPRTAYIPPGVCHGFWFAEPALYVYGLSSGWCMAEELGCRYDDPALGLDWQVENPRLSARDQAPSTDYAAMRAAWIATQATH